MDDREFFNMTPQQRDEWRAGIYADLAAKEQAARKLAWKNRRLLGDRWPDGVLAECERVESEHPDWQVWWQAADERTGQPARYTARWHSHPNRPGVSGETGDELAAAIEAAPDEPTIGHLEPLAPRRDG